MLLANYVDCSGKSPNVYMCYGMVPWTMVRISMTSTLHADLAAAYRRLTADLWNIGRTPEGKPCFPEDDGQVRALVQRAAARCGAGIAAAAKREKRRLLLQGLLAAHKAGADICVRHFGIGTRESAS